jgi:putative tryptophan/tyrosine transport system substrate-binding protein
MRRREFIAGLGSATAWPLAARAQQIDRVRRLGVLMGADENDPEAKGRFSEFMKELAELGWTDGRNLQIDIRWAGANADRARVYAKELVALEPDVLLAQTTGPTAALQQETKTIPIVFVGVSDPIGAAWVAGLSRPAENITGLLNLDVSMGEKWLELLLRSRPASSGPQQCFIPTPVRHHIIPRQGFIPPVQHHIIYLHSRPPPGRSEWSRSQRLFIAVPKSKRP